MKNYDLYLNRKSVLNCETETDIQLHDEEISKIFEILQGKANAGAVIKITYNDPGHWDSKPEYMFVASEDYTKVVDGLDNKNGVDFAIYKGEICAAIYGQNYTLYNSKEESMEEAIVDFRFIDEKQSKNIKTFKECLDFLDNSNLKQEFLGIVHKKSDFFKNTDILFEDIRTEIIANKYEKLFDDLLASLDFTLIKNEDNCNKKNDEYGIWSIKDEMCCNWGNIEGDRFNNAAEIFVRLERYIEDCTISDMKDGFGVDTSGYKDWSDIVENRENFPEECQWHIDYLDLVCNHANDIDLNNCKFEYKTPKKALDNIIQTASEKFNITDSRAKFLEDREI